MKTEKQIFSLLLALCFFISILPEAAFAAGDAPSGYGITVDGVTITDENKSDILGDADGDATTVTFDPDTSTLTLQDATFTTDEESVKGAIVWNSSSSIDALTICANGDNRFTRVMVAASDENKTLTFNGSGSITLTGPYAQMYINNPNSLSLVFDGVTFNADARQGCYAITGNDVTIKNNANVTVSTHETDAIRAFNQLNISDSTVTASAISASAISASGSPDSQPNQAIVIRSSKITANGTSENCNGIYSAGTLTIQQSEVEANGYYPGIFSENDMTIADSVINAASEYDYGIYSGANLSISGSREIIAEGGAGAGGSFTITSGSGNPLDVFVGSTAADAELLEGSPFAGSNIDMSTAADYYYFCVKAHAHTAVKTEAKAATATAAGNIAYWYCAACGKYFSDAGLTKEITQADTVIPATGQTVIVIPDHATVVVPVHNRVMKTEAKAATCTEVGNIAYWYCADCGGYFSDEGLTKAITQADTVLPATGHKRATKVEKKAATCTEAGNPTYWYCADCSRYFSDEELTKEITQADTVLPATGHKKVTKVKAKAATATAAGNIAYWYCVDCGKYFSDAALTKEITKEATTVAATGSTATATDATTVPKTGDRNNMTLWLVLLVASFGGLAGSLVYNRKKIGKHEAN